MINTLTELKSTYRNENLQVFVFNEDLKLIQTCQSLFKIAVEEGYMLVNIPFLANKKNSILDMATPHSERHFKAENINWQGLHLTVDIVVKKQDNNYIVFVENLTEAYSFLPPHTNLSDAELISELKKIKTLQRLKTDHFAKIAHDIKLPLTEIVGTTYLMENYVSEEKGKEYLKALTNASRNLDNMLNDLVNFTKSESMQLRIVQRPFALEQVIWSVIKSFEFKTTQQNIPIFLKVENKIAQYLWGDPNRLSQIVYNLIDNALKFTKQGKIEINVSLLNLKKDYCRLLFEVKDTGIGIPTENLNNIFDTYNQARKEDALSGFGIGLSIVKQLIELQDGCIEAKSEIGKGTCFAFELPFLVAEDLG